MSDAFDKVRDQVAVVTLLSRALESDRLASAYLFEGPSGVGKELTALSLAEQAIGDANAHTRIQSGGHPDVRVFRPRPDGKRNIPVDYLRQEILPLTRYAPFEANRAFFIFPESDLSFPENPSESANALLKTLEEPKPAVHFILLTERPDRLLPTIRSRCQRVRFGRLSDELIDTILTQQGIDDPVARAPAVALSEGRADRALALADGSAQLLLEAALALDDAACDHRSDEMVRAAESHARASLPLPSVLDALAVLYRDIAAAGLGLPDERFAFASSAEIVRARASRLRPEVAATRVEQIQQAQLALERNANPQTTLDSLLFGFRR